MNRTGSFCLAGVLSCLLFSVVAMARSYTPADFPLRVHLFGHNSHSHYMNGVLVWVDGEGRANLYENGQPRAFDYSYRCENRLMNSVGYETYMARWKKPGKTLEIFLPVMGKPCDVKVALKQSVAYYKHHGYVEEEPAELFKQWMEKHQYDPEHGKDVPVADQAAATEDEK